jgi:large subunit ribosomal protein L29
MNIEDLRVKTEGELKELVVKLKQELMNLRFQQVHGQLSSPSRFKAARKEIARIKTIMSEKRQTASKGV